MDNRTEQELKDQIKHGADQAIDKVSEKYDQLSKKVGEVREKTGHYVKENPEKSMLIAAGIGALTALITFGLFKNKSNRYRRYHDES